MDDIKEVYRVAYRHPPQCIEEIGVVPDYFKWIVEDGSLQKVNKFEGHASKPIRPNRNEIYY